MDFKFNVGDNVQTVGSKRRATEGEAVLPTTITADGIDIMEILTMQTACINFPDNRLRHVEATTFLTIRLPPNSKFVTEGMKGGKTHYNLCTEAKKAGKTGAERKGIGSPMLYVAYNWLRLIGTNADECKEASAKAQLTRIFEAKDIHSMDKVFSHAQAYHTKDKQRGYLKFKMLPWYKEFEYWLCNYLIEKEGGIMEGMTAPCTEEDQGLN